MLKDHESLNWISNEISNYLNLLEFNCLMILTDIEKVHIFYIRLQKWVIIIKIRIYNIKLNYKIKPTQQNITNNNEGKYIKTK